MIDEPFEPDDDDDGNDAPPATAEAVLAANRRLRRIRLIDEELAGLHGALDAEIADVTARYQTVTDRLHATRQELAQWLALFHQARLLRDSKAITVHLPEGDLVSRKADDRVYLFEDEVFVKWAAAVGHDELVRTPPPVEPKPAPDKKAAKAALDAADIRWDTDRETGATIGHLYFLDQPVEGVIVTPPADATPVRVGGKIEHRRFDVKPSP